MSKAAKVVPIGPVSNDGAEDIAMQEPYAVRCTIEGTTAMLFHRWSCEAVDEKAKASKNSKAKKTDNVESYVYRDAYGELCLPGEYLRMAILTAAKFKQDPRSPRKSAMDLFKAAIVPLTELATLNVKTWDFLDRRRVMVQRNGITRVRPAMSKGWQAVIDLQCLIPEYIESSLLHEVVIQAGRLVGVGDFRPTYGRFQVVRWQVL